MKLIGSNSLINSIEIRYFRSIYKLSLKQLTHLNVLSGCNDAGKSNILKALNLFFNNQTDLNKNFDFLRDFSYSRREEIKKKSIKGKQFINIKITFNSLGMYPNTLPKTFTVSKTWLRDDEIPHISSNIESHFNAGKIKNKSMVNAERSLSIFLNRIKYFYIPAIKDGRVFENILLQLQTALFKKSEKMGNSEFSVGLPKLNAELRKHAEKLTEEFLKVTGISAKVSLPSNQSELYKTFQINTEYGKEGINSILLDHRGDGIRVRFLPAILNFVAQNSNSLNMWGFEEPENSLEYKRHVELFEKFKNEYSKNAQIFTTSHSVAFISEDCDKYQLFRIYQVDNSTCAMPINSKKNETSLSDNTILNEELGNLALMKKIREIMLREMEKAKEGKILLDKLKDELKGLRKPVVLTEGKTDVKILNIAWRKLYPGRNLPFELKKCDNVDPHNDKGDNSGGNGGTLTLRNYLVSYPSDAQNIVIGIFDRDKEGLDAYKLDGNFKDINASLKKHKNGKAFAICIPVLEGLEKFNRNKYLPIEFLFDEEYLKKEVEGRHLKLIPRKIQKKMDGVILEEALGEKLEEMKIDELTKKLFSEKIVRTFPKEAFVRFEKLFELIESSISESKKRKK